MKTAMTILTAILLLGSLAHGKAVEATDLSSVDGEVESSATLAPQMPDSKLTDDRSEVAKMLKSVFGNEDGKSGAPRARTAESKASSTH